MVEIVQPQDASGGASGFQTPIGTIDGSNTIFTFSVPPHAISVDGTVKQKVSSDGTVNWTGTTVITLLVAPTFDCFGLN